MQTVTIKCLLNDWDPAVKIDHDSFETGYYTRQLLINGSPYLSIRKLRDVYPPMPHHVDITKDGIHRWTYECAYGFTIFGSDLTSNSGLHYVKIPDKWCKWRLVNVLNPPPTARAGAKVLLDSFVKAKGFEAVEWYVGGGLLDTAWILQKVANCLSHFEIEIDGDPEQSSSQSYLKVTPICVKSESDIKLFDSPVNVTLYDHQFKADWLVRWFDHEKGTAKVIAHVVSAITARNREDLNLKTGWYLLSHPRPTR